MISRVLNHFHIRTLSPTLTLLSSFQENWSDIGLSNVNYCFNTACILIFYVKSFENSKNRILSSWIMFDHIVWYVTITCLWKHTMVMWRHWTLWDGKAKHVNHHTERQKMSTLTREEQTEGGRRGQTSVKSFQNSLISQEFE